MKEPWIKRKVEGGEAEREPGAPGAGGTVSRVFKLTIGQGSDGHLI